MEKWLELDLGAQRNIVYRTRYFDCRWNVNNNNNNNSNVINVLYFLKNIMIKSEILNHKQVLSHFV